jgi:GxxExxY protein
VARTKPTRMSPKLNVNMSDQQKNDLAHNVVNESVHESGQYSPPRRLSVPNKRRRIEFVTKKAAIARENIVLPSRAQQQVALAAQRVFRNLGCGFSESVYRDALCIELNELQSAENKIVVKTDCEVIYQVRYRGRYVGIVRADIVLQYSQDGGATMERIVIELKTTNTPLTALNARQLLTYLRLENVARGVLINFEQRDVLLNTRILSLAASSTDLGCARSDCSRNDRSRNDCSHNDSLNLQCIVDDSVHFQQQHCRNSESNDNDIDDENRCICGHFHTVKVLFLVHSAAEPARMAEIIDNKIDNLAAAQTGDMRSGDV